jgi:peptide deformylase
VNILHYPHPALRHRSRPIRRVDRDLRHTIAHMFELMYEHRGIGLAANQINLPLQLFVANIAGEPGEGTELAFINPVLSSPKGKDEAEEGCLSLPSITANVVRPAKITIQAYDPDGNEIQIAADGLLARVIQHEFDHLQGVLFIDRLPESTRRQLDQDLAGFESEFRAGQQAGTIPSDEAIRERLHQIESEYC